MGSDHIGGVLEGLEERTEIIWRGSMELMLSPSFPCSMVMEEMTSHTVLFCSTRQMMSLR